MLYHFCGLGNPRLIRIHLKPYPQMKLKWSLKGKKVPKTSTWSLRACKDGKGTLSLPFQDPSPRIRLNAAKIIQPNGSHQNMIEGCPMLPSVTGTPSQRPWLLTKMGKWECFVWKSPLGTWEAGVWPPLRLSTKPVILDKNPGARKMDSASALGTSRAGLTPDHLTPSPSISSVYFGKCCQILWKLPPQSPILNLSVSTV